MRNRWVGGWYAAAPLSLMWQRWSRHDSLPYSSPWLARGWLAGVVVQKRDKAACLLTPDAERAPQAWGVADAERPPLGREEEEETKRPLGGSEGASPKKKQGEVVLR